MYKITLKIDGMACGMCEAHTNDTIRRAFDDDVKSVTSSHTKKETVIIAKREIPEADIREVMKPTGYDMQGYKIEPYEKKGFFSFLKK